MYPTGCHPTSLVLNLLKLSFLFLVYLNNSLNSITLPFICLTKSFSCLLKLLVILVLSLIKICHLLNISLLFLNHALTIFGIWDVFVILGIKLLPVQLLLLSFTLKLTYCNSLLLNLSVLKLIVFNLSLTLLLVLSPKPLNFITLLLFSNLSTGST